MFEVYKELERQLKRRQKRTATVIQRIAQLKIDSYGLDCTTDEYIAECKKRHGNG